MEEGIKDEDKREIYKEEPDDWVGGGVGGRNIKKET
jgi:hypothetical protein